MVVVIVEVLVGVEIDFGGGVMVVLGLCWIWVEWMLDGVVWWVDVMVWVFVGL